MRRLTYLEFDFFGDPESAAEPNLREESLAVDGCVSNEPGDPSLRATEQDAAQLPYLRPELDEVADQHARECALAKGAVLEPKGLRPEGRSVQIGQTDDHGY